jgi:hypothetical protein
MVKGKVELPMTGGVSGGVGIASWAGPGSWSDDRMPWRRAHAIPVALPGIQSAQLGALGPGGSGGLPEARRPWTGAQAIKPMASTTKSELSDELGGFRAPLSLSNPRVPVDMPGATGLTGGPYLPGGAGVLPPVGTDPYASLPDFLRAPLVGQSGTPYGGPG